MYYLMLFQFSDFPWKFWDFFKLDLSFATMHPLTTSPTYTWKFSHIRSWSIIVRNQVIIIKSQRCIQIVDAFLGCNLMEKLPNDLLGKRHRDDAVSNEMKDWKENIISYHIIQMKDWTGAERTFLKIGGKWKRKD